MKLRQEQRNDLLTGYLIVISKTCKSNTTFTLWGFEVKCSVDVSKIQSLIKVIFHMYDEKSPKHKGLPKLIIKYQEKWF